MWVWLGWPVIVRICKKGLLKLWGRLGTRAIVKKGLNLPCNRMP